MEKVQQIVKQVWKYNIIIEFILSLIFGNSVFQIIFFRKYIGVWNLQHLIIGIVTGTIILFIIIKNTIDYREKLEKIFLSIATPLAIGYLIFMMILYVPDEHSHLSRAFNIGRGILFIDKDINKESIPITINEIGKVTNYGQLMEQKEKNLHMDGEEKQFFNTFEMYFPTIYVGPAIGSNIANLLKLNIVDAMYLMRLMNVIIYLVLGYFTIKWMPFGKLLTFTFLCIPMVIHQAASTSADAFIDALALAFIAYSMKLLFKEEQYTLKEKIIYFCLALLATLNKTAYVPLVFLARLIILKKNKVKKDKIFMGVVIAIMIFSSTIWYVIGSQYEDTRSYVIENNINSSRQLQEIKNNPINFAKVLVNTTFNKGSEYLYQALGRFLGRFTTEVDIIIPTVYLIMLVASVFLEKSKVVLDRLSKILVVLLFVGMYLLVLIAQYLGWTPVGGNIVEGVQGRYFLPFLILPFICAIQKNKYIEFKKTVPIYTILICLLNIGSILAVIKTFC